MTASNSSAPNLLIKIASAQETAEIMEELVEEYRKLNVQCDLIISKIRSRKNHSLPK
jgi:hypothetical protein